MSISLATHFIDRHIETYQEGGFWQTEFKGGACHDIDEMDNVIEKFVRFNQADGVTASWSLQMAAPCSMTRPAGSLKHISSQGASRLPSARWLPRN